MSRTGLHEKDTIKIIEVLKKLRDLGNTVLVVEHDFNMIKAADRILELGPGAGEHGGDIVAQGSIDDIQKVPQSLTGKYLNGLLQIEIPQRRRQGNGKYLTIVGATANNLKNIDVRIPLGKFICVTGVSGVQKKYPNQ